MAEIGKKVLEDKILEYETVTIPNEIMYTRNVLHAKNKQLATEIADLNEEYRARIVPRE